MWRGGVRCGREHREGLQTRGCKLEGRFGRGDERLFDLVSSRALLVIGPPGHRGGIPIGAKNPLVVFGQREHGVQQFAKYALLFGNMLERFPREGQIADHRTERAPHGAGQPSRASTTRGRGTTGKGFEKAPDPSLRDVRFDLVLHAAHFLFVAWASGDSELATPGARLPPVERSAESKGSCFFVRALISVYDKTGIVEFARQLVDLGWELLSTGGTLRTLTENDVPALAVSDVTGFPEILDGRVKTLHPAIHGGLLARLEIEEHRRQLEAHEIEPIGMLVSNLYPFEQTVLQEGISLEDAIEQIDIGGPAMLRAASKNHAHVIVVVDPADQSRVIDDLKKSGVSAELRRELAAKAFQHTAEYDTLVSAYLRSTDEIFPSDLTIAGRKVIELRYGENPHQSAAAYLRVSPGAAPHGVLAANKLQGKEISYNNLLDADAAWSAIQRWGRPAVSIVKHMIPCGLAVRDDVLAAYRAALAGDPVSAFGGIVAVNRPVSGELSELLKETFYEVILAPGFDARARETLTSKKNLRLLEMDERDLTPDLELQVRSIQGALLLQQPDLRPDDADHWTVATDRAPTEQELVDLRFAWRAVRHVKSNAIVLAKDESIVGVGAGQPNRVESVNIAVRKASERAAGSVLASDAYFPFADGVEAAIAAGVTAVIQPGGSIRDADVLAAANAAGIAMIFTGERHFLH